MMDVMWVGTALMLLGNGFNIKKKRFGFVLWIMANIIFLICDISSRVYSRALLDVVQTVFCTWGIIEWNRKGTR
jgi:nicotinamide riboside transporter PnuC